MPALEVKHADATPLARFIVKDDVKLAFVLPNLSPVCSRYPRDERVVRLELKEGS